MEAEDKVTQTQTKEHLDLPETAKEKEQIPPRLLEAV
jgi:hypothetical protein